MSYFDHENQALLRRGVEALEKIARLLPAERSLHAAISPEKPEYLSDSLHMKSDPTREIRNPNSDEYNIVEVPKGVGIPYIVVGSSGVYLTKEYADVNRRLDSLNDLAREIHNTDSR